MLSLKQHSMIKIFAARADRVIPSVLVSASLLFLLAGASALHAPAQELAEDPVAIFNAGQDAHEKGDLVKAVEYYLKAIEAAKEFPEAEFQLGNAYRSMGKADLAEAAFRKAVELRPGLVACSCDPGRLSCSETCECRRQAKGRDPLGS